MIGILKHKKTGVTINLNEWEMENGAETLFTTQDGVEMILGQKFWVVTNLAWEIFSSYNYQASKTCLYFSSEQRAKEYVELRMNTELLKVQNLHK